MSETATTPESSPEAPAEEASQAPEAAAAEPTDDGDDERKREHLQKIRSENKALRDRLKAAEPLLKAAQEAEDAKKGEVQKAIERAEAAERTATEREAHATRLELAIEHQIPKEGIALIGSGSREDMEKNAKIVGELFAAKTKTAPPPTNRPVEGLRPGASPESPKQADDSYPDEWKPRHLRDQESRSQYGQ